MFPVIGGVKLKKGDVECCICIALMSFDWPNEPHSHVSMRPRLIGWLAMLELITSDGSPTLKLRYLLHTINYANHKTTASEVALVRKNHVTYDVRNSNCFFL